MPVTQDASASAYQIMSYLLLDVDLAQRTNLIPTPKNVGKIRDIYSEILEELKPFLREHLEQTISTVVCSRINRKLIKALFMPLVYGKTVISMARDIRDVLSSILTHKECYLVAALCMKFWLDRYPNIVNLRKFISNIGWFTSSLNRPVYYSIPFFTTVQDYMCLNTASIWIFDRINKKRRKVTLRIPTQKRDRRKSNSSDLGLRQKEEKKEGIICFALYYFYIFNKMGLTSVGLGVLLLQLSHLHTLYLVFFRKIPFKSYLSTLLRFPFCKQRE